MEILGIDIGGSGIKGAPVDVNTGQLTAARAYLPTPQPSRPAPVADTVAAIVKHFDWQGAVGCTFPAVVKDGVTLSAANVDKAWLDFPAEKLLRKKTRRPVLLLNDADAAGIAELEFGAGRGELGVVLVLTFGTGIGSALFYRGVLVPNTELGHLQVRGDDAEHRAAARIKTAQKLSWQRWARRVNEFLARVDKLFSPDLLIIGGGVSQDHDKFLHLLESRARIAPARYFNDAGIVGAALAAKSVR